MHLRATSEIDLSVFAQFRRSVIVVAMRLMLVCFDEYFAFAHFGRMGGDIQIVASGILAIVNDLASDAVQRAVVEVKSFFGQPILQAVQGVMAQVVGDDQGVRGIAIFDFALGQTGQKLISAIQLAGRIRTEHNFTPLIQLRRIKHANSAVAWLFTLQYLNPLEKIQCLVKLVVVPRAEFCRLGSVSILFGIRWRECIFVSSFRFIVRRLVI